MSPDRKYVPTKLTPEMLSTLLALRGELPVKLYLLLADLGGHLEAGWLGSIAVLTARFNERSGRHCNQTVVGDAVSKLVESDLLRINGHQNGRRRFCLGSPESGEPAHQKVVRGSPESGEPAHQKVVTPITLEKGEREERGEGERAGARDDVVAHAIPVRGGKLSPGAPSRNGDLGARVRATDPRFDHTDEQVMEWCRRVGAEEVERQILAWPDRKTDHLRNASAYFSQLALTRAAPPKPRPKSLPKADVTELRSRLCALGASETSILDALARRGVRSIDACTEKQAASVIREFETIWEDMHGAPAPRAEAS